tara:strand:- start:2891 stop:3586 length:696 start_codon:yes stop_codon:yes gene_type:complete
MNWVDVLKTKQIVTPTTDINIKKVPKKKKRKECIERLREMSEKINSLPKINISNEYGDVSVERVAHPRFRDVPEEIACWVLDEIEKYNIDVGIDEAQNATMKGLNQQSIHEVQTTHKGEWKFHITVNIAGWNIYYDKKHPPPFQTYNELLFELLGPLRRLGEGDVRNTSFYWWADTEAEASRNNSLWQILYEDYSSNPLSFMSSGKTEDDKLYAVACKKLFKEHFDWRKMI